MNINELLDQAKNRANIESDYKLAKALNVSRGWISEYRKGKRHPSNEVAVQLATLAGIDEMKVIAEIEMQTATTEKKREFWKCYLESRGIAAAACMIALGISIMLTPKPAQAGILQMPNYDEHHSAKSLNAIYIMRISGLPPSALVSGDQIAVEIKASIPTAPVLIRSAKFIQKFLISSFFSVSPSNSASNSNGWTLRISAILTAA